MKVLVYQIGQLGDTVVSVPALRALRHNFGQTALVSLLHDETHRLVTSQMVLDGSGLVDEFIAYSPEKTIGGKLRTHETGRILEHRLRDQTVCLRGEHPGSDVRAQRRRLQQRLRSVPAGNYLEYRLQSSGQDHGCG